MNFGDAMNQVLAGERVGNDDWKGEDMFIFMVPGSEFEVNRKPLLGIYPEGTKIIYGPHIDMRGVDGIIRPWNPSQADMFSTHWCLILNDGDVPF